MRTAGFDQADEEHAKREEAEEIRLLYVAATRAKERLVIPWFAEKGGRIDLLARGFKPEAGELVQAPDLESLVAGGVEGGKTETRTASVKQLADRRREWQESRSKLLVRAARPFARVSPSKLTAEAEPRDDEPVGAEREKAMDFGSAVHDALEIVDLTATVVQQRGQVEQFIARTGLSDADRHRAVELVSNALGSELLARARHADQVYRELPFTQVVDEGLMEGKIDLLFCENGQWVLVDYKTDARVEVAKYAQQLRAYEAALRQMAGIELAQKLLFFLVDGTVKEVS
jgi:ATP-dependent helicase/nuclease subunit A